MFNTTIQVVARNYDFKMQERKNGQLFGRENLDLNLREAKN